MIALHPQHKKETEQDGEDQEWFMVHQRQLRLKNLIALWKRVNHLTHDEFLRLCFETFEEMGWGCNCLTKARALMSHVNFGDKSSAFTTQNQLSGKGDQKPRTLPSFPRKVES